MKPLRLLACIASAVFAFGVSVSAASAPVPYIEAPRMSYQLENQSFDMVAWLPPETRIWNTDGDNPDYAWIKPASWEVSTDNGVSWRELGGWQDYNITMLYHPLMNLLRINALKMEMTGWQYRANVEISYNNDQSVEMRRTNAITLNVKPSFVKCPVSLAFDGANNLYVADALANAIWKITADSKISVFAGSATGEAGALDGSGTQARFKAPRGITYQGGKLYVADFGNNAIRVITSNGMVSTLAGSLRRSGGGYQESSGTNAWFDRPAALTVDASGKVYVVDSGNNVVRKITTSGATSYLSGKQYTASSSGGLAGSGNLYVKFRSGSVINSGTFTASGTANGGLWTGSNIVIGGDLILTNTGTIIGIGGLSGQSSISGSAAFPSMTGTLLPLPGGILVSEDASPVEAESSDPESYYFRGALGVTLSPDGQHLYVADSGNDKIVKVALADGRVTPLELNITGVAGDPLADEYKKPMSPAGLRFDKNNNLYFADALSSRIVKVSPSGSAQVVAGLPNWLWRNDSNTVNALYTNSFADGNAGEALLNFPSDIAIDNAGNLYIADSENAAIRKITQSGTSVTVTTLALEAAPPSPSAPGLTGSGDNASSGGGGGALSPWSLLALGALAAWRLRRR